MIEVIVAPENRKQELWELYQDYAEELSQYDGEKRRRGSYHYPYFDFYWQDERRTPFLILYDHEPIGFCLLQDAGINYRIDEFYILPVQRQRGFGRMALEHIRDYCRMLGRHGTLSANVYVNNERALKFWQSVGFKDTGRRSRVKDLRLIEAEMHLEEATEKEKQENR
ncbi:MAG: hypothetical protein A2Z18_02495 [Armatimonadetes bacterium RBG_16_58_9]|nr:MAG: hypothetical protein A2Z18_02495 [Armatimonadetes bacterium RBG_16_58_9]